MWGHPAFIAEVPELPGCASDGKTYKEALLFLARWLGAQRSNVLTIPWASLLRARRRRGAVFDSLSEGQPRVLFSGNSMQPGRPGAALALDTGEPEWSAYSPSRLGAAVRRASTLFLSLGDRWSYREKISCIASFWPVGVAGRSF